MVDQKQINERLASEITELKIMVVSLAAYIAGLPGAEHNEMTSRARAMLGQLIDPEDDFVQGDQVARGMHHVQNLYNAARTLNPIG